jgi:hypothetical protein
LADLEVIVAQIDERVRADRADALRLCKDAFAQLLGPSGRGLAAHTTELVARLLAHVAAGRGEGDA